MSAPSWPWIAAWLALLAAAVGLTLAVVASDRLPGDERLLRWMQNQPFPSQRLSDFVRALTTTQVAIPIGLASAAVMFLWGDRRAAIAAAIALAVLPFVQAGLKDLVDRPRPGPPLADIRASITSPSFPSGHIMSGTAAWIVVALAAYTVRWPLPMWARHAIAAGCAAIILLNAPANVWTGVHWPSDVVGGYLWALVLVLPAAWLASGTFRLRWRPR